ncbi:sterol desaturase family protein [Flavobacterium piscis]|uniref:Sterol desaturase/sphingolipid hydroxylase (Fatty acid hydroxylase superfamily) n=1 Tax=Flavobacterium piscis TaxID=1114874 RepID=A0ABU1YC75_9FLAO|nr:sterol desaturase family protein [Flavobacterium piscis]MDR7211852.1 sterol desaturase/sphingolipid hydroxylase (fatty acid hydroxylase superfamily) [Flavobacterium piscis]
MMEGFKTLNEVIKVVLGNFTESDNRLSFFYLIPTVLIAYLIYFKTKQKGSFLNYIFNKKTWLSKSAKVDYVMLFFNSIIKVILIGPYLAFGFYLAFYTDDFLARTFGYEKITLSITQTLILYTLTLTLVSDFTTYVIHYLMHRFEFLWEFHKIHHAATTLNPVTQYRIHPVELILVNIKETLVFGLVMGLFDYLSAHQVEMITYLGINIFSFIFMFFGANLRHSSIKFKYFNFLEYIFMSPYQHQIHHSNQPEHFDRNMGSKLAVWDWMFGTLLRSKQVNKVTFGISKEEDLQKKYESFFNNLFLPFVSIYRVIMSKNSR